jgi:FMN phosphatase YigB (HAD superfamily)
MRQKGIVLNSHTDRMNSSAAPELKKTKDKKEAKWEDQPPKPEKHISKAAAKRILAAEKSDDIVANWCEQWIDNFVRTYSYPPQLKSNDFTALLSTYFPPEKALNTLAAIRSDYRKAFGNESPSDDTYQFLLDAIRSDPQTLPLL